LLVTSYIGTAYGAYREEFGARDRFWKHQSREKTLNIQGVEHYHNIEKCLQEKQQKKSKLRHKERRIRKRLADSSTGDVFLVEIKNAITPEHAALVKTLSVCIQEHIPSLSHSRNLYEELNLEEDFGDTLSGGNTLGGNTPTFMAPIISIFLPEVIQEMQEILEIAYEAADWMYLTIEDDILETEPRNAQPAPKDVGIRTSEHLTYKDFPSLGSHTDSGSSYTLNIALSGPEDYEGGEFFIVDKEDIKHTMKVDKYSCIVFLGGKYFHGVSTGISGNREMFSTEYWAYPDIPPGITLDNAIPAFMEQHIKDCSNAEENPCKADFPTHDQYYIYEYDIDEEEEEYEGDNDEDDNDYVYNGHGERFLQTPLKQDQIQPIRWENDRKMVSEHALRIGLPPELRKELKKFMEDYGIIDAARHYLFSEPLEANSDTFRELEHRSKKSNLFQIHRPGMYDMSDNTWFDPGNEATHEEELAALRRGNFDLVLDAIGNFYGLKSLTVYGIGIFALSQCNVGAPLHRDGEGTDVINVLVAIELVDGADPELIISDENGRFGEFKYEHDVGLVIGGDVLHGTIAHNYRESQGMRLVASIYIADVTDRNVEAIMDENSSMFPLEGDIRWMNAQRGRHWGSGNTLANDKGRDSFEYDDSDNDYCQQKARNGWCTNSKYAREMFWKCPKSCNVYDPKFDLSGKNPDIASVL